MKDGYRRKMSNGKKVMGNDYNEGKQMISSSVPTGQVCGGEDERSTNFYSSTQVILNTCIEEREGNNWQ